jgi:hypothetical protein
MMSIRASIFGFLVGFASVCFYTNLGDTTRPIPDWRAGHAYSTQTAENICACARRSGTAHLATSQKHAKEFVASEIVYLTAIGEALRGTWEAMRDADFDEKRLRGALRARMPDTLADVWHDRAVLLQAFNASTYVSARPARNSELASIGQVWAITPENWYPIDTLEPLREAKSPVNMGKCEIPPTGFEPVLPP